MHILAQFLLRLTFGLAYSMAITSRQKVSSGFFRNHLYVTLGLTTLAALATYARASEAFWYAAAAAIVSYVGSVLWLYEKKEFGKAALLIVGLLALIGSHHLLDHHFDSVNYDRYIEDIENQLTAAEASTILDRAERMGYASGALLIVSNVTSGLLLGTTAAAMFLGHWYLNSPTMELAPLKRLLIALGAAVILQIVVSAIGLACEVRFAVEFPTLWWLFIALRWGFGLIAVAALTWMAWQTLKIPNTQSATGILYVAVIGVFVGELSAALLSAESAFPL